MIDNLIKENIINDNYIEQSFENNIDLIICSTDKEDNIFYEIKSQNFLCTQK